MCLEQTEKGKLPCYTGSVLKKEASAGQMGASNIWLCRVRCGHEVKSGEGEGRCYGLNVCCPQFICWSFNTHTHTHTHTHTPPTVWWALEVGPLGVIRVRWGHKGRAPMMGLMSLKKKRPESSPSLQQIQQGERYAQTKKSALTRHGIC